MQREMLGRCSGLSPSSSSFMLFHGGWRTNSDGSGGDGGGGAPETDNDVLDGRRRLATFVHGWIKREEVGKKERDDDCLKICARALIS